MEIDINDQVLAAFQVEYREHLEQIRVLLGQLQPGSDIAGDARVQDAFRLVHSLKGGARVSALRPVEQLGHGLETLLDHVNQGRLRLKKEVISTITMVLDSIEDWMSALARGEPCPDTDGALNEIERILALTQVNDVPQDRPAADADLDERLRRAFESEFAEHVDWLKSLVQAAQQADLDEIQLSEPTRIVHTLAGAARVVDFEAVENVAASLEARFRQDSRSDASDRPVDWNTIAEAVDALEAAFREDQAQTASVPLSSVRREAASAKPAAARRPDDPVRTAAGSSPVVDSPSTPARGLQQDSVRVNVESLDRLLRSSGELLAQGQHQEQFSREFDILRRDIDELDRQRETVRHLAAADLHRLNEFPAFERISRYMEGVDRQVHRLARQVQSVFLAHQRNAWMLRTCSQQIHRHVREVRMVPVDSVFHGLRKMVRDLAKDQGKSISFEASGFDIRADRRVLQTLRDPITHMLRNCVTHGIEQPNARVRLGKPETGRISLEVCITGNRLRIIVDDDGSGVDVERLKQKAVERNLLSRAVTSKLSNEDLATLMFAPGLSTTDAVTELAGRGMGLSIVQEAVSTLKGDVHWIAKDEPGARFHISVPTSISSHGLIIVTCGNQKFAVPLHGIDRLLRLTTADVKTVEGQPVIIYERQPIPLIPLSSLLGISGPPCAAGERFHAIVIKSGTHRIAARVDALIDERDALVQDLDKFAATSRLAGAVLLEDQSVSLVVNPAELLAGFRPSQSSTADVPDVEGASSTDSPVRVLVVDDSFTTRTLEKSILETHGYQVHVAVDGTEALSYLRHERCDLVITDIEMPRMDGFSLLEQIKADRRLAKLPVILVTSRDQAADKQHGLDLGAEAYIVKRKFDHQDLLKTIQQVL